ncbi:hypothetical protein LCGC14_2933470, partial [marine sediment metagenome]
QDVANNKDNRINAKLMLMFLVFLYFLMAYCFWNYSKFYPPEASSAHGGLYDNLMFITLAVIMFVQLITQVLIHWFSYKYHGKKGRKALFYADNDKLEFVWTIIPVIVLSGLIIYGLFTWSDIMNFEKSDDALVVELYAQRFNWKARYSGEDRILGNANVRLVEGVKTIEVILPPFRRQRRAASMRGGNAFGCDDIVGPGVAARKQRIRAEFDPSLLGVGRHLVGVGQILLANVQRVETAAERHNGHLETDLGALVDRVFHRVPVGGSHVHHQRVLRDPRSKRTVHSA